MHCLYVLYVCAFLLLIAVAIFQKSKLNLVQRELLIALSKFSNMWDYSFSCYFIYFRSSYNNLADLDEKERQRQDRNDIRYLHLLRTLIHNQVMFVDPALKEEGQNPAHFRMLVNTVYTANAINIIIE